MLSNPKFRFSFALLALAAAGVARADLCENEIERVKTEAGTLRVIETPKSETAYSADFSGDDIRMTAGEKVYFVIPKAMRKSPIDFIILGHRQDPSESSGGSASNYLVNDYKPAYLSVQFLRAGTADDWRYWNGPASAEYGAKFAEVRRSAELEGLYEWRKYGTGPVSGDGRRVKEDDKKDPADQVMDHGPLYTCLARVVASGPDVLRFSNFVVKTAPARPKYFTEQIFTPKTAMGDYETAAGRWYGGGERFGGTYPGAIKLRKADYTEPMALENGWSLLNEVLRIPVKKGQKLSTVEVAAGDARGSDGRNYLRGGGVIQIAFVRADGTEEILLERENVGPQGVIKAAAAAPKAAKEGDRVEIRAIAGTIYVMGARIGTN